LTDKDIKGDINIILNIDKRGYCQAFFFNYLPYTTSISMLPLGHQNNKGFATALYTRDPLLTLLIFITVLISSCKKGDTIPAIPQPVQPADCRIKTSQVTGSTTTYDYNPDHSIKKITFAGGNWADYVYSSNTLVVTTYNASGGVISFVTYNLNANGLAASYWFNNDPSLLYTTTYDSEKQRTKTILSRNGSLLAEVFFYYSNGNLIKDSLQYTGAGWETNVYDFYTDKVSTTENINFGKHFLSPGNKNCLKTQIRTSSTGIPSVVVTNFTHIFDNQERVIETNGTTFTYL
jgi:antitoxin component YwqK of YwqJK toxin-antitoxin module